MANPAHANASGTELHEAKRIKQPVRAASTANVTLTAPGATIDGVTMVAGDRMLLKDQTTAADRGIYVWNGAASTATRASDAAVAADFVFGFLIYVREGTANGGKTWQYTTSTTPVVVGATALAFTPINAAGSGTVTSVALTMPAELSVAGSPVTTSGTLAVTKANQSANTVFAGPASGGAAAPTFRAHVAADLPVMGASGVSHAQGAVPDPGASAGTTKFLREDASWQVPAGTGGGGGSSTGGGGSGALVPIMAIGPLTVTQATLPFAGIPQTGFRNLRVVVVGRSTLAANNANLGVQFNNDTGSNYSYEALADASGGLNRLSSAADTAAYLGFLPASTAGASEAGTLDIKIPSYTGTTFQKAIHAQGAFEQATSAGSQYNQDGGGFWRSIAAISTLTLVLSGGNFDVGSYACLYGEMDTTGVLLTPQSNLLSETILTAAAASITTTTIPQGYKRLRVEILARGDNASNTTDCGIRFNGDTGSNYNFARLWGNNGGSSGNQSTAQSRGVVMEMAANSSTANVWSPAEVVIQDYARSSAGFKSWLSSSGPVNSSNAAQVITYAGWWANQSAITSITLVLAAGNFVAGTTVRVYGEPAASGGTAVGTGTRLRLSGNQSTTTGTATAITWDTEDSDADNQHYTSAAALTGTVSKTAASATLAGVSTLFTTELSVGQVISVPGTAAEKRVVIAIASDTSLTVNSAYVNTAATQTATRVNSAVVFRQPGFYTLEANIYSAALASGAVTLGYYLNSLITLASGTIIGQRDPVAVNASAGYDLVIQRQFSQWDFVEVVWTQNAGTVNVLADERTHWSISARPTVIVAVPYVRLHDSKAQNTAGGTFTSGADQQRILTLDVDSGGIATVASNQVTLPMGTYEYTISAPGYQCGAHQAFLYNVTDTAEVKRGTTESSGTTSATTTRSVVTGRVTLSAAKVLEVRHRCTTTSTTNGFGLPANFGLETYTTAEFRKVG